LITASEIAARAGVSQAAVSNWQRRYADSFPAQVVKGLWDAAQVDAWLKATGRSPAPAAGRRAGHWPLPPNGSGVFDEVSLLAYAASLVTLVHLGGGGVPGDPRASAGAVERQAGLPAGALAGPLSLAGSLDMGTLAEFSAEATARLSKAPAVEVFEQLVQQLEGTRWFGEHSTPTELARMLALLSQGPGDGRTLLDPACGVGSVLVGAAELGQVGRLIGYEVNPTAWALCVQRLTLHGLPISDIHQGDFFEASIAADLILADPPILQRWPADSPASALLARHGAAPGTDGAFAWLLAARDSLTNNGTAVVITSNRPTFAGAARAQRYELLRSGAVAAVIALPAGAFANTSIPATAWVLQPTTTRPGDVLMVNARTSANQTESDQLREAAAQYQAWRATPTTFQPTPGLSALVPLLELMGGDAVLTPARWTEIPSDPHQARNTAQNAIEETAALATAVGALTSPTLALTEGPVAHLVSLHQLETEGQIAVLRPRHIHRDLVNETGEHPFVSGIATDGPRIVGYLDHLPDNAVVTRPGDVLLSTLSQVRATVDRAGGHVLGQGVWCIRPASDNPAVAPDLLALLLTSPRISEQTVGTTVQRLRHPKDVTIPLLEPAAAAELAAAAHQLAQTRRLSQQLTEAADHATRALAEALDAGITTTPLRKRRT
jgi:hypothetical protein